MSYSRWGAGCPWYIYWIASDPRSKNHEMLALWHADHQEELFSATYSDLRRMLDSKDFSAIPGFTEHDWTVIDSIQEFVDDVDAHWSEKLGGEP